MIKVTHVLSDSNIGGAGKCLLEYLKNRNRKKIAASVILPRGSLLKKEVEALNVPVFEVDCLAEKSFDLGAIIRLKKIFSGLKPDIVHAHASLSARIAARSFGAKIVYTRHSVFPQKAALTRGIGKKICGFVNNRYSDKIIAVAEAARENLIETGADPKKITVILNGVTPLEPMLPSEIAAEKSLLGINSGEAVVGIAARLTAVKGHDYFLETARLVQKKFLLGVKFIIAGTGPEEAEIRARIKQLNLEDSVIMAGFVSDMRKFMNIIDVQLNCSFGTEATSLALLEGMSLGRPAVVTNFGGNGGVIESGVNGFLVPEKDPLAMANSLAKLITEPELYAEMRENAKRIFAEKFTAKTMARKMEDVYYSLAR